MTQRANQRFENREQAGTSLGLALATRLEAGEYVVLGLLRGGVPIAAEVARALGAELGALAVHKLGVPSNPELAYGAMASYRGFSGRYLNEGIHRRAKEGFGSAQLDRVEAETEQALAELAEVFQEYSPDLAGRIVVICDDGLATGATVKAAVELVQQLEPERIIIAAPVAPPEVLNELSQVADEAVALLKPGGFTAVGAYYEQFQPVERDQVLALLHSKA